MTSSLHFDLLDERIAAGGNEEPHRYTVTGSRGIELAYEIYAARQTQARDLFLFYHGGGATMRAGYGSLASELVRSGRLMVCLTDIRGHGASGGRRGHTEAPLDVWSDVDFVLAAVRRKHLDVLIHLGGHSSAAGMLLNYFTVGDQRRDIASLVLIAPEFGYKAGLSKAGTGANGSFARSVTWPFLLNAFSGGRLGGGIAAVTFDYTGSKTARLLGCVDSYTVNMALAVTPSDPARQLARLDLPTWIGIAGDDELTDASRLEAFVDRYLGAVVRRELLPDVTHLGIILAASGPILDALGL